MMTTENNSCFPVQDVSAMKEFGFITKQKLSEGAYGHTCIAERIGNTPEFDLKCNKFAVKNINISDCRLRAKTNIDLKNLTQNIEYFKTLVTRISHKNLTQTSVGFCFGGSAVATVQRCEKSENSAVHSTSTQQSCIIYDRLYLFKEFTNHGSLQDYLNLNQTISEQFAQVVCNNTAEGLQYLHSNQVTHGNINCNNVLLFDGSADNQLVAKLTDFGLANIFHNNYIGFLYDTNNYFKDIDNLGKNVFTALFAVTQFISDQKKEIANDLCRFMKSDVFIGDVLKHKWFIE